ncbi:MAG: VOC family protein [Chthonomonadaceae bacterium]|nr:VOC family protein [Chthonomonadaceae bacterium]
MVYHGTIPFGAPSQLRLQMGVNPDGHMVLTVLTPFDQPMGHLHHLQVSPQELRAICDGKADRVIAQGEAGASIEFTSGTDDAHEMINIHYVDPEKWTDSRSTVTIEDLSALIGEAGHVAVPDAGAAEGPSAAPITGVDDICPVLAVRDVEDALAFYTEKLGFGEPWKYGEPVVYGGVKAGKHQVHFSRAESVAPAAGFAIYVTVENVDAIYARCTAHSVPIVEDLGLRPYKMRDFSLRDPNGHIVAFGQEMS